jgi:hypothetical protein
MNPYISKLIYFFSARLFYTVTGFIVVHVDGVGLYLWTATTNWPTVYSSDGIYENGEPQWNDTYREEPKNLERNLSQSNFIQLESQHALTWARTRTTAVKLIYRYADIVVNL